MKNSIYCLFIVLLYSYSKENANSFTCAESISYAKSIQPIFVKNCTKSGCHDGGDMPSLAEYITAKDASAQIQNAINKNLMPPTDSLSASDKEAIGCWITNGCRNN